MSVSKRLRFEVLRRDNHTCQYCGGKAPNVTLHIDHVKPKTLGGTDGPDNLVTACMDCNNGKTSVALEAPLVAAISQRNLDWEIKAQILNAKMRGTLERDVEYFHDFQSYWQCWSDENRRPLQLPPGANATIMAWSGMGVPMEVLELAVDAVMGRDLDHENRFKYFCGIVWKKIREASQDNWKAEPAKLYTQADVDRISRGTWRMAVDGRWRLDPLSYVIDGLNSPFAERIRWVA